MEARLRFKRTLFPRKMTERAANGDGSLKRSVNVWRHLVRVWESFISLFLRGNVKMAANGPCHMYRLKPINDLLKKIELPTCMYKMRNLYGHTSPFITNEQENHVGFGDSANPEALLAQLEKHQEQVLKKLEQLKEELQSIKTTVLEPRDQLKSGLQTEVSPLKELGLPILLDVVVNASPQNPPLSLWPLRNLLGRQMKVTINCHMHSSVQNLPENLEHLTGISISDKRSAFHLLLTLIWKDEDVDVEMMVSPVLQVAIRGEVNLVRYLGRLLKPSYDDLDPVLATEIDLWLDLAHASVIHGKNCEQQSALKTLNSHLGKCSYLVGDLLTVADIAMWSALNQKKLDLPSNVKQWMKRLNENPVFSLPEAYIS